MGLHRAERLSQQVQRWLIAQEKIFSMHSSDQKSILKVDEEFKTVLIKISNTIKSWQMISTDPFSKKKYEHLIII